MVDIYHNINRDAYVRYAEIKSALTIAVIG